MKKYSHLSLTIFLFLLLGFTVLVSYQNDQAWARQYEAVQKINANLQVTVDTATADAVESSKLMNAAQTQVELYKQTVHQRELDIAALEAKQEGPQAEESFYQGVYTTCLLAGVGVLSCNSGVKKFVQAQTYQKMLPRLNEVWDWEKLKGAVAY